MLDWSAADRMRYLRLAQTLGLTMARRAADILERHRAALTDAGPGDAHPLDPRFAADDAIFSAVLDAANDCLGQFDPRPAADRWCDALLELLLLAQFAAHVG